MINDKEKCDLALSLTHSRVWRYEPFAKTKRITSCLGISGASLQVLLSCPISPFSAFLTLYFHRLSLSSFLTLYFHRLSLSSFLTLYFHRLSLSSFLTLYFHRLSLSSFLTLYFHRLSLSSFLTLYFHRLSLSAFLTPCFLCLLPYQPIHLHLFLP